MSDDDRRRDPITETIAKTLQELRQMSDEKRKRERDEVNRALARYAEASRAAAEALEELARTVRALKGDER